MNNCFYIFHCNGTDIIRQISYESEHKKFIAVYDELDTKTVEVSSHDDYVSKTPPHLVFDKNGYSLDGISGWRWGELGIWASNFTAWNNFLESDYDNCLLVEDDIVTNNLFFNTLDSQLRQLPDGWDIYHAFVPGDQYHKYSASLNVSDTICSVYQDWSMLCYVLSRQGAEKCVDIVKNHNIDLPLDWFFFRQQHLFKQYTHPPQFPSGCDLLGAPSTFQLTQDRRPIG